MFVYKDSAYKLKAGDKVCFPKDIEIKDEPEVGKMDETAVKQMGNRLKEMIIFENEHVIVINKDNGVPS